MMIFYAVASYDNLHVYNFLKRKKKKKEGFMVYQTLQWTGFRMTLLYLLVIYMLIIMLNKREKR